LTGPFNLYVFILRILCHPRAVHPLARDCAAAALRRSARVQVVGERACVDIAPLKPENVRLADERIPDAGLL